MSLFLRIFLWLWLAMVAVAVVLVLTSPFFTRSRSRVEHWQEGAESLARERVDWVADRIGETGTIEGRGRRSGGRGRHPTEIFIFDGEGREVMGRPAPKPARDLARRVAAGGEEEAERRGGLHLVARPVSDPEGKRLVVVGALNRPPRAVDLLEPRALWLRLAILALVVGALSFWLARYLSAPVGSLRRATQRLSGGDLSARVGGPVDRRSDEIGGLARDFDEMAERLESLLGSQRRLLRDVSHELRSPLARLQVALELARDRAGSAAGDPLDRIEREAGRLDSLIGQLLLLERLETGEPETEVVDFDLTELLSEVIDDASFEAAPAGREVRLGSYPPCPMLGHPGLMRSAFDNVIRNAIRHTPEGSEVEIELQVEGNKASVSIRDHGEGVPDGHLETLFEPFARVAGARERTTGGAGLGLAITRRAVEFHGGTVTASNHSDGGLEVVIHLPVNGDNV
jgi:two-component system sensor histidine kinase CpxA